MLKTQWSNDEIINACIDLLQQNLENLHHNKIMVIRHFLNNNLKQINYNKHKICYMVTATKKIYKTSSMITILCNLSPNNIHWNLLNLNISVKACYIIDSRNSIKSADVNLIISFLCTINLMDSHNIDYLSIDNWKTYNKSSPRFPEQKDTNSCCVFVLMNVYQILKYGKRKELFSANDVKTFRDYIFDMILHAHFDKH